MNTTLVVMAAGMGSRYGGVKQMDPMGPSGEFILDYSVYDALQAGFNRVVFVIRRDIEEDFRRVIGERLARQVEVAYVTQSLTDGVGAFDPPPQRAKPWGTGHAMLVCRDTVREPFVALNADDFYGRESFTLLHDFLTRSADRPDTAAMPGYVLRNTVSEHGSVSRGVCRVGPDHRLQGVTEHTAIEARGAGFSTADTVFTGDEIVSMNMWAFKPAFFDLLQEDFAHFLRERGQDPKAEFFAPSVVSQAIARDRLSVDVLDTPCRWFGATYPQDRPRVVNEIRRLVEAGVYPASLWA
jgi:NDP-sugar pyrophosphorylase family protein